MDILQRIEILRIKKGWKSIYEMAKECDLDQSTISAWYTKGRNPSVESLEKICKGVGITMSRFFAEEQESVSLTHEQRDLLDHWDMLSKKQKSSTLQLIKDMSGAE